MSETKMLVKVEIGANNNRYYELTLDGDNVTARWGRVGNSGQTKIYGGGEKKFQSLLKSKAGRGYKEVEIIGNSGGSPKPSSALLQAASLRGLAKPEFATDARISKVITTLVDQNAHSIATVSGGQIKLTDGQLQTPLGVIGRRSLEEAQEILDDLSKDAPDAPKQPRVSNLENFLRLVPQKVGLQRGWEDDLLTPEALAKQNDFLSQLRDSLDFAETTQSVGEATVEASFRFSMGVIESTDERFTQVQASFAKSLNSAHPSRRYKLVGLYDITDGDEQMKAYEEAKKRIGNEKWLWHGSRASNILSILSKGFYVPPASASFSTGRMFGDGIYGSNQSTKSLNYSGGVWKGQHLSNTAFMFSMQAVMGNSYRPTRSWEGKAFYESLRGKYDSIDVQPGKGGVANHEAVIFNVEQINMRYLCEFSL